MVLPASHRVSRVRWYSGSLSVNFPFRLQVSHLLWCCFPTASAKDPLPYIECPQPQRASSLVWALSFSLAATREIDVSFSSSGYLDVSVLRVCPPVGMYSLQDAYYGGLPHSVILGSTAMCAYPKLIAACHDLLRLLMPRHSPCALLSLIFFKVNLFLRLKLLLD